MTDTKIIKSKYKIGQMVWYIADGYVTNDRILAIFVDKWDTVLYSMDTVAFSEGEYSLNTKLTFGEDCVYPSKEALIKSIKEQEDNE